ncbi:MAG: ATP-binding protein [Bacteroidaceae bacterium]|nr:ATP-binding protein [Bacteroidaceae bacterium]
MEYKESIIGREHEQRLIKEYYDTPKAELIAVYGRRRVGKTYLIRQCFDDRFDFRFTGLFGTPRSTQLSLFKKELERYSGKRWNKPQNWYDAFEELRDYISGLHKERIVVFLDELPWMDTPKSSFLSAFSYFWNQWASAVPGLKLFVCGSATTWMLSKFIGDKGGMHGRTNRQIYLRPFTLFETEKLLQSKGIDWNRYQIVEAYMTMGGIPYYLDMLENHLSLNENIDLLFFHEGAILRTEYDFIFRSLFKNSKIYRAVVELLATRSSGMSRAELLKALKLEDSGDFTEVLDNLCKCDFLRQYSAFEKKSRDQMYQLVDLFSLFHLQFVEKSDGQDAHFWSNMLDNPKRRTWEGYAFEQLCLHHVQQIKQRLGISGILSEVCSWTCKPFTDKDGTEYKGTQIDLLIDRHDATVNLCEMKFSVDTYALDKDYAERLNTRKETFRTVTGTKKSLHTTMITTYGLKQNKYSGIVQREVTMNDLFREEL